MTVQQLVPYLVTGRLCSPTHPALAALRGAVPATPVPYGVTSSWDHVYTTGRLRDWTEELTRAAVSQLQAIHHERAGAVGLTRKPAPDPDPARRVDYPATFAGRPCVAALYSLSYIRGHVEALGDTSAFLESA